MYIGWNVQEAENVGILASLKISHFPFWFPTLKGSIREREGNGKNPFPKFGNGKGMKKIHSRNSGREGNEKNSFPHFGNRNQGLSIQGIPKNGNGNGKKKRNNMIKKRYLENMWHDKDFSPHVFSITSSSILDNPPSFGRCHTHY